MAKRAQLLSALVATGLALTAGAPSAHAEEVAAPVTPATVGLTIASNGVPLAFAAVVGLLNGDMRSEREGFGAALIVGGVSGIGLGVTAAVLQGQQTGACQTNCTYVATLAGLGITLGLIEGAFGVYFVASKPGRGSSFLLPMPMAIQTERGIAPGVGVFGLGM
jgi:hypothetical protein